MFFESYDLCHHHRVVSWSYLSYHCVDFLCDDIWKSVYQLSSSLEWVEKLAHVSLPDRGITWEVLYKQGDSISASEIRSKQEIQRRPRSPSTQTVASLADQTSSPSAFNTDCSTTTVIINPFLLVARLLNTALPLYNSPVFPPCYWILFSITKSGLDWVFTFKNSAPEETIMVFLFWPSDLLITCCAVDTMYF